VRAVGAAGTLLPGCYSCDQQAAAERPPREDVLSGDHWRVVHAFNATVPGWLVLVPTRHVVAFTELSAPEADALGGLVRRLSLALQTVTGCVKTYLMQFSEAEGFAHLHVHLVPRLADHPADAIGPHAFSLLSDDRERWLPAAEMDRVAVAIRAAMP